jgi:hypothetical protein
MGAAALAETLADNLGISVEPRVTFNLASEIARGLKGGTKQLPIPVAKENPIGLTKILDLPLRLLDDSATKMKHLVDIVTDVPKYDWNEIKGLALQHKLDRLPEPFRPKSTVPVPFVMQIIIVDGQDLDGSAKVFLLKHFIFEQGQQASIVKPVLQGQGHVVNFGSNTRGGPKTFQYMLDRLGGQQVRFFVFDAGTEDKLKNEVQIDDAYDFILASAPRQEGPKLDQSRWVKKQLNDPESPVFLAGLSAGDVAAALRKIREMEVQADVIINYPFFLSDVEDWYLEQVVFPLMGSFRMKAVLMLGMAGIGKTPVLHVLMSAMSRWHKRACGKDDWHEAEFRTASSLDFFRLEKGMVERPDSLDDSDLNEHPMSKLKAYFDMTLKQAQTKERWGAAVWPQGQLRVAADNKFDPTAEMSEEETRKHKDEHPGEGVMPYGRFAELVRPAFSKDCSAADIDAMLKRCNIIVHCKTMVYFRPAGVEGTTHVHAAKMETKLLLKPETIKLLEKYSDVKGSKKTSDSISVISGVRDDDDMIRLATEEHKVVDGLMDKFAPSSDEAPGESEFESATRLARSFSDRMLTLPYGFGGVPPPIQNDPSIQRGGAQAYIDQHKRECLDVFDSMMRAMREELLQNIEEQTSAFFVKREEEQSALACRPTEDDFLHEAALAEEALLAEEMSEVQAEEEVFGFGLGFDSQPPMKKARASSE